MARTNVFKFALTAFTFAVGAMTVVSAEASAEASAATAKSPVLSKTQNTISPSGKTRSSECLVYADGVTINRNIDGVLTTEEKFFKLSGAVDAKIDEVVATKSQTKVVGPMEFSYEMLAHRTSTSGAREAIILSSFNGIKGEDIFNPSSGATILKEVLNSVCGN